MVAYELDGPDQSPESADGVDFVLRRAYQARRGVIGKLSEAAQIYASVAAADADVVLTRGAVPATGLLALSARLQRRRFVYASANVVDFDIRKIEPKRRNVALFHLGVRLADRIVVQNAEQRQLCEQRFRRAPSVIKSIAERAERRTHEPAAFLWAGRMVWYKRPLEFVELARAVPQARFWMVGMPERGEERLLDEVRLAAQGVPNLELLGPLPRGEVMRLVQRAVAVVNTADYEGLSNTFLEGWARGVPALALTHDPDNLIARYRIGGFAEGSSERLAALARELWDCRADQRELAARCQRYVLDEHSPDDVYAQWFETLGLTGLPRAPVALLSGAM